MTRGTNDSLIDQIVAQVLSQLRERTGSTRSSLNGIGLPQAVVDQPTQDPVIELPDAVITEERLKETAKPGSAICISGKALITPSARDYIKAQKISVNRAQQGGATERSVHGMSRGIIIASHLPAVVQSLLAEVKKQWTSFWTVEIEAGISQVASRTISAICRGETGQILVFSKTFHQVACSVNRNAQCRAAVVRNAVDVHSVREEMQANVLCVNLDQPTYIGLRGILKSSMETKHLIEVKEGSQA